MTVSFQQLIAEHDALDAQAAAILRMCREAADAPPVSAALARLASAVDDHLANEDGLVYPVVASMKAGGQQEQVAEMIEQLAALRADWRAYLAAWPLDRIRALPERFHRETAAMLPRLRERVRTETEMLYAGALRQGLIPLREAAA